MFRTLFGTPDVTESSNFCICSFSKSEWFLQVGLWRFSIKQANVFYSIWVLYSSPVDAQSQYEVFPVADTWWARWLDTQLDLMCWPGGKTNNYAGRGSGLKFVLVIDQEYFHSSVYGTQQSSAPYLDSLPLQPSERKYSPWRYSNTFQRQTYSPLSTGFEKLPILVRLKGPCIWTCIILHVAFNPVSFLHCHSYNYSVITDTHAWCFGLLSDGHPGGELWPDYRRGAAWGGGPFPSPQCDGFHAHEQSAWIHRDCPRAERKEESRYCYSCHAVQAKCGLRSRLGSAALFQNNTIIVIFPIHCLPLSIKPYLD